MKKLFKLLAITLIALALVGCTSKPKDENTLIVSATLDPHSKILEFAQPILKEKYNIDLEIIVLDDYYIFNRALNQGDVDANYFQHVPFFNEDVVANEYDIVNAAGIHIEPFGFYSNTITDVSELEDGATIVISNSVADYGRILSILEANGLITLKENTDILSATLEDIDQNPKNLKFVEVKPDLLTATFNNDEGDLVAINGNYAIQAGLNPTKDAVILEQGGADNPYVNIVAVKKGNETNTNIVALIEVLKSDEVKQYILDTYADGSVIPAK